MAENRITRSQLASFLGCSVSTVRKYEREFAKWLITPAGVKASGQTRFYKQEDVRTLEAIHHLRQEGASFAEIKDGQLDEVLESGSFEVFTESAERAPEGEEAQSSALVPVEKYALVVGELQATEREMARVLEEKEAERERHEKELRQERERVLEAEKAAAAAQATSEERDRLLEERDKAQATTEELRKQLEDERTKNWWQRVRGK